MLLFVLSLIAAVTASAVPRDSDPCATIAGQRWVVPSAARACFQSFPVNETIKTNVCPLRERDDARVVSHARSNSQILDVVERTLAFHTSVNYQVQAPAPFSVDVHEDILGDIARIRATSYPSEFEFHLDLFYSFRRLRDGHCAYLDFCYDFQYVAYLPTPVVLVTDEQGEQAVHIAPEAFDVARVEFSDHISVWQDALPKNMTLESLSGAKVLAINGNDPFAAVNANAETAAASQGLSIRQNGFFSSYHLTNTSWNYTMGDFARMIHPLVDSVDLTVQRINSSSTETVTIPYYSRFDSTSVPFTDSKTYRQNHCVALNTTNGVNLYASNDTSTDGAPNRRLFAANSARLENQRTSMIIKDVNPQNILLPEHLLPGNPVAGSSTAQFYLLDDGKTGVLALGDFYGNGFEELQSSLLSGLQKLVQKGATQLIVDVTNNGGGDLCISAWLHRIIAGPKDTTEPQAYLDTKVRAGALAQKITKRISEGADWNNTLWYNPIRWRFANNTSMPEKYDWLAEPVKLVINGREDAFSQRLGQDCQPFGMTPPEKQLFDPQKVVLAGNGQCGSSCTVFLVTMVKKEGSKAVVIGGKKDVKQYYAGTVGGQASLFPGIDTQIKSVGLKDDPLAPPDFLTNSFMGLTWRLSFGVWNTEEPEEWQDRPADVNLPVTLATVNNPMAIWNEIAASVL